MDDEVDLAKSAEIYLQHAYGDASRAGELWSAAVDPLFLAPDMRTEPLFHSTEVAPKENLSQDLSRQLRSAGHRLSNEDVSKIRLEHSPACHAAHTAAPPPHACLPAAPLDSPPVAAPVDPPRPRALVFNTPLAARARRARDRNRFKTQPITFDEIKEVDEDAKATDSPLAQPAAAFKLSPLAHLKPERADFGAALLNTTCSAH